MADSYTCKGGRKTAGSNKPAASKESRTETRINPPAELPKLGKELVFSFCEGGWGEGDEPRGWGVAAKTRGCECIGSEHAAAPRFDPPARAVLDQKSPRPSELRRAGSWEQEGRDGDGLSLSRGVRLA